MKTTQIGLDSARMQLQLQHCFEHVLRQLKRRVFPHEHDIRVTHKAEYGCL